MTSEPILPLTQWYHISQGSKLQCMNGGRQRSITLITIFKSYKYPHSDGFIMKNLIWSEQENIYIIELNVNYCFCKKMIKETITHLW